ncbi:hypothetical protein B0J11DRAFT_575898 [Dendryphion nanum]|uniref:Uncharacterized protein n=1 Tax=Dendryphion nanum TaxID=256645 RepID=A0A9P9ITY0_9PLEO|nr:hypothetical protein B0J11DRAFT_575898 [Dendryphion nanum]
MPRPNRYHPYPRPQGPTSSSLASTHVPVSSPRYPEGPSFRLSKPLPSIEEQPHSIPQPQPVYQAAYHSIFPGYIRAVTTDGTPLITRSIMRGPDGLFHIQMEAVRFPSECRPNPASNSITTSSMLRQHYANFDPRLVGSPNLSADVAMLGLGTPVFKHSCASSDNGSDIGDKKGLGMLRDDDCAVVTDGEDDIDAEGEIDIGVGGGYEFGIKVELEHRMDMLNMMRKRELGM